MKNFLRNYDIIILIGIAALLILVGVLCNIYHYHIFPDFDINHKSNIGVIGDAFNGITAPFISLASAILIYYSFKAQRDANKLISDQWVADKFEKNFDSLKADLKDLEFQNERQEKFKGKKAVDEFEQVLLRMPDYTKNRIFSNELITVLGNTIIYIESIKSSKLSIEYKKDLLEKVLLHHIGIFSLSLPRIIEGFKKKKNADSVVSILMAYQILILMLSIKTKAETSTEVFDDWTEWSKTVIDLKEGVFKEATG